MCNKERIIDLLHAHLPFFSCTVSVQPLHCNSLAGAGTTQFRYLVDVPLGWTLYQSIKLRRATKRDIYHMPRCVNALELGCGLC